MKNKKETDFFFFRKKLSNKFKIDEMYLQVTMLP